MNLSKRGFSTPAGLLKETRGPSPLEVSSIKYMLVMLKGVLMGFREVLTGLRDFRKD